MLGIIPVCLFKQSVTVVVMKVYSLLFLSIRTNFYLPSSCHLLDVIPLCCLFAILLNSARGVQHTILEYLRKTTRTVTTTNASQSTTPPQTKIMSKIQTIGTSTKINHVDTSTICWDQKNLRKASTPFHKKLLKSSKEGGL